MKILKFIGVAALAMGLSSCGGNQNSNEGENKAETKVEENKDQAPVQQETVGVDSKEEEEEPSMDEVKEAVDEMQNAVETAANSINAAYNAGASEDWDAVLKEYDEYVTDYVKLYKKAMAGDMNALTQYASLLENAQQLQTKLQSAGNSMSAAQATKFNKITQKMLNALQ